MFSKLVNNKLYSICNVAKDLKKKDITVKRAKLGFKTWTLVE